MNDNELHEMIKKARQPPIYSMEKDLGPGFYAYNWKQLELNKSGMGVVWSSSELAFLREIINWNRQQPDRWWYGPGIPRLVKSCLSPTS